MTFKVGTSLKQGLLYYYKLDEQSGAVVDSMSANNGTASNCTTGVAGQIKSCYDFNGADSYVEIPHQDAQLGANLTNGFTISAWINPRSAGETTTGRILDKSAGTSREDGFSFNIGGEYLGFNINNGGTKTSAAGSCPYGVWKHVLVTISSAQLANFYVNGVRSGTANQDLVQGISTITTTNAPRIGNRATATDKTFNGLIDEVGFWNRVLSLDEIRQLYNNGHGFSYPFENIKLGGGWMYNPTKTTKDVIKKSEPDNWRKSEPDNWRKSEPDNWRKQILIIKRPPTPNG